MTAQPAELQPEVLDLDTSRIYQFPRAPEPMNPIDAEPVADEPALDAVLNRPKPKRQRSAKGKGGRPKGSRNKKDIEAAAKRREQESAARAPAADAAPAITTSLPAGAATVPTAWLAQVAATGDQGPIRRFWRWMATTSAVFIMGAIAAIAVGALIGVIRLQ